MFISFILVIVIFAVLIACAVGLIGGLIGLSVGLAGGFIGLLVGCIGFFAWIFGIVFALCVKFIFPILIIFAVYKFFCCMRGNKK